MRRWPITILLIVAVPIILFGTILSVINSLIPQNQNSQTTPFLVTFVIVYAVLMAVATLTQAYGYTLRDLLPEKTLKEIDRERYKLLKSKSPDLLRKQAQISYDRKDYDWAVAFAESLMRLRPKDSEAHEIAGKSLINLGDAENALRYGRKLIELKKLSSEGYQITGEAFEKLNEWEAAINQYEKALLYAPQNSRHFILTSLSKACLNSGNLEKAISHLEDYLQTPNLDIFSKQYHEQELSHLVDVKKRLQNLGS